MDEIDEEARAAKLQAPKTGAIWPEGADGVQQGAPETPDLTPGGAFP